MKLEAFLILFSCLFIKLFAKTVSDGNDNSTLKEYTYKIKNYEEEIKVENNSIVTLEFNNFPSYGAEWFFNDLGNIDILEYLGKGESSNCDSPDDTECTSVTLFKFHVKEATKKDIFPTLEFVMFRNDKNDKSKVVVNVRMVLKEENPLDEHIYTLGFGSTEVTVEPNSLLILELVNNSTTPVSRFSLFNSYELTPSELVEFQRVTYKSNCNTLTVEPRRDDCGETSVFTFHIKDVTDEKLLPTLRFTNEKLLMSSISTDPIEIMEITLKLPKVDYQEGGDKDEPEVEHKEYTYEIDNKERKVDVMVEPNSKLILELGHNSTTPAYEWNIYNLNRIVGSDYIEFQSVSYRSSCGHSGKVICGKIGVFTFLIKDVPDQGLLPTLQFAYVNMAMSSYPTDIMNITLKLKGAKEIVAPEPPYQEYIYQIRNDTEILIEGHSMLKIDLDVNLALGYEWSIANLDEVKSSEFIEIYGSQYDSLYERMWFRIKDVTNETQLPKLIFTYQNHMVSEENNIFKKTFVVTLKLKGNPASEACTFKDYPCCTKSNPKVYYHDDDGDWGVEHGEWCFIKSPFINIVTEGPSIIDTIIPIIPTTITTTTTATIKTISSMTPSAPECFSLQYGYPCCKSNTPEDIVFTDSDGDWGKENHQWCGITLH